MTRREKTEPFYVGIRDIAEKSWTDLRKPEYRRTMYGAAYRADLQTYGKELALADANALLAQMHVTKTPAPRPDALIHDYYGLSDLSEALYGEALPTLRFWFRHKGRSGNDYVIGGVPDGIAKDYCYEFKSPSGGDTSVVDNRTMGLRQAELYSHAFKRPSIRVQVVRLRRPGPFPFKVRDLALVEKFPAITRPASHETAMGILDRMDQALSVARQSPPATQR